MKEFIAAALSWICIGIALALLVVNYSAAKKETNKEKEFGDYMVEGMCLGMCVGTALGGNGLTYGMLIGMIIGMCIKKKREEKTMSEIKMAGWADLDGWMTLVRKVSLNFPGLETEIALEEHRRTVLDFIGRQEAVCAKEYGAVVGVLLFSKENHVLCFLAVDPSCRRQHIAEKMFKFMMSHMDTDKPITVTTYRDGVPEGVAARAFYQKLGFVPGKMAVEFGSEVQEFVMDAAKWQTT